MKNILSIENYGVAAMTTREMKTTNGGGWFLAIVAAAFIIGLVTGLAEDCDSCQNQK